MCKYEHEIVLNYLKRMLLNKYEAEDCNIENGLFNNEVKIYIEPNNNIIRLSRYYKGITLDWKPSSLKSLIFQLNVIDNEL